MRVDRTLNRLYKIQLRQASPVCFQASVGDKAWLWHGQLGHVNFKSIKQLGDKNMARGVPKISHPGHLCRACLAVKQARAPFPQSSQWRARKVLELVHVDLCCPITPSTASGNKYFRLLIDDSTR